MTAQPVEQPTPVEQVGVLTAAEVARQEDEDNALAEAVAAVILVMLLRRLKRVRDGLDRARKTADEDPEKWTAARRAAAGLLRDTNIDLAGPLGRGKALDRAAELGAKHVGLPLPDGYDPGASDAVQAAVGRAEAAVREKLAAAAKALVEDPAGTPTQIDDLLARVDATQKAAETAVGDVVMATVSDGSTAAATAAKVDLVWRPEDTACLNCKSMAGGAPRYDGLYRPVKTLSPRMMSWLVDGIPGPPAHKRCRCRLVPAVHNEAADIRRRADYATAYGWSLYDRLPELLKGVDLLLRQTRLQPKVRADAQRNVRARRFVVRRPSSSAAAAVLRRAG